MNVKLLHPNLLEGVIPDSYHLPAHHSVPGDWDFRRLSDWSVPAWLLDTDDFISAPSSLALRNGRAGRDDLLAICKFPGTNNLIQGRVQTYIFPDAFTGNDLKLYLGIKSDHTVQITADLYFGTSEWHLHRVSWWTTYDSTNTPSTRVLVEWWNDPDWIFVSQNDYPRLYGPDNEVAIGQFTTLYYTALWDNTKIYIPSA